MPVLKTIYVFFAFLLFTLIFTEIVVFADEAIISNNHLNVRTEPGTQHETITQVHKEEVYPIIQEKDDWIEIQLDNNSGWISKDYIEIKKESMNENEYTNTSDEFTDSHKSTITITMDNTHLRDGPSTKHNIVTFANKDETYEVNAESDKWYEVIYEEKKAYIYKSLLNNAIQTAHNPLRDKTIVIDAGHGGHDVGSIGTNGTYEKDITDITARELEQELTRLGAKVILTRPMDQYVFLSARASLANLHQADAFISIHYNSFPDSTTVTGINTYYFADQDQHLAQDIQDELILSSNANDRDIAYGDYQVLRQNYVPSILLELGFISNEETEELLLTNRYQTKLVTGIINGLIKNMR